MTATLSPFLAARLLELDAEIDSLRLAARAERALDALPDKTANPFGGANERLQARETEREQAVLREEGTLLGAALAELQTVNDELSGVARDHSEAANAIRDLKADPIIVRWLAAPQRANVTDCRQMWNVVAGFLASEATWDKRPSRVSDRYVSELPEPLHFADTDRPIIRKWEALAEQVRQLNARSKIASGRHEKLLQMHPALRTLPVMPPPA